MNTSKKEAFAYTLKSTGKNYSHYGACEVCGKNPNETFIMSKFERCFLEYENRDALCHVSYYFGHKQCLSGLT